MFSLDGKHIVYSRYNDPELNKWRLLAADADGGNAESAVFEACARRPSC